MASRVPKLYQKQKKMNSLYYLKKAKQACSENSYAEAFEYFVNYFESLNDPSQSMEAVQTAFTKLVCKIGTVLEETDDIEELLKCYLQAINLFPNNYLILNNLGAYMFKIGEIDIARRYLELAVKANKDYLPAEKNLLHVKWHQIPRWHFRMLNDRKRNIAYSKAIVGAINEGYSNVIDIGAGCGLLSLLASQNPLANITAIEENKTLYKMCLDIFKENGVNNVNILNCYSTELTGPPCRCNLLVTEIFDVALFGERALESIYHALTVLCTEDCYKIIPCGAKLYVTGINSEELARKYWYIPLGSLNVLNLNTICVKQGDYEPYDAEYLSEKKLEFITETEEVFHINFYNHSQIYLMLNDDEYYEIVYLKCKKQGIIHALAVWFDLNLTELITLTTNPLNENCVTCWEQAVFYLDHPVFMNEGEILTVKVTVVDCKLKFTVVNGESIHHNCFEVSKEIISFMNDSNLVQSIIKLANEFNNVNLTVVDCNVFPLFGLLMAKNNMVYHTTKSNMDVQFFKHILMLNDIPLEKFTILDEKVTFKRNVDVKGLYFFDPLSLDGSLDSSSYKEWRETDIAIRIPQMIKVNVQLIHSSYIDNSNRVMDENLLGFKIEKYMNQYTGNEHPNLENFEYSEYSSPVSFVLEADGEKSCDVLVNKNGLVNALYFWYDLQFYGDVVFSTLNSSHYKKTCFFLDEPKTVKSGDIYNIVMKSEASYFKLFLQ